MENLPEYKKPAFKCPSCGSIAQQNWEDVNSLSKVVRDIHAQYLLTYRASIQDYHEKAIKDFLRSLNQQRTSILKGFIPDELAISRCTSCRAYAYWINEEMIWPRTSLVSSPNQDLSPQVLSIYQEAASIVEESPKGAAALLRLALQLLLKDLGEKGKNINDDIKSLVAKGLSPKIQKALDLVRFIGNNAVHPGQINLDDKREIAYSMFKILNLIADEMITRPKEIDDLYEDIIPEDTRGAIEKRDGK